MLLRHRVLVPLALLATLLTSTGVHAQPLADKLPGDALIYVAWRGADHLGPAYDQSHLKAVLDASNIPQLVNEFLPRAMKMLGDKQPEAAEVANLISAIGPNLWRHPTAFYFGGLDMQGGPPMPRVALVCDAGTDAPKLLDAINAILARAPQAPVQARINGTLVVVSIGKSDIGLPAASLAQLAAFKEAFATGIKDPAIAAYIDVEGLQKLVDTALAQAPPPVQQQWAKIRDVAGLASLKRVVASSGFDGKDWATEVFVAAPAPRTGLIASLFNPTPLSPDALRNVPREATFVAGGRANLAAAVNAIRGIVGMVGPREQEQFDRGLQQAGQAVGFDIQKDLLAAFGTDWVLYAAPQAGGNGVLGMVLVNKLADPANAEQSLTKLEQFANRQIPKGPNEPKVSFRTTKVGDTTIHYLAIPLIAPSWAVKDGNLYVAL